MKKDNAWQKEKFCMTLVRHVSDASFIKRDKFKPSDSAYKYGEKQGTKLQL